MNRRKLLYWLPLPLIVAGIGYMLITRKADTIAFILVVAAAVVVAISARAESDGSQ